MEINCAAGKLAIRRHFKGSKRVKQLDYGNGAVWGTVRTFVGDGGN